MNANVQLPAVSLVVCSRGRPQLLIETVESILEGDEVPQELIVIDQSHEVNHELAAKRSTRCDLRYVHMDRTGVSLGRNEGVRLARHDLLVFTDDDVLVEKSWFGAIVRAQIAEGERSLVVGRVLAGPVEQPGSFMWDENDYDHRIVYEGRLDVDPLYPTNVAAYRSSLESVGLYDERLGPGAKFPCGEDNDLAFRLLESGYRIVYVPEPVVIHRAWRPPEEYLSVKWRNAKGHGAFLAKHLSLRDRHMLSRLVRSIGIQTRRSAHSVRPDPELRREGLGHAVTAAGLTLGATKWLVLETLPDAIKRSRPGTRGQSGHSRDGDPARSPGSDA
jgi:GT2 family glycosyltransferase